MNLDGLLQSEFCLRLTLTLLHFLWQGAAIALAVAVGGFMLRRAGAAFRYWVYVAAMGAMALCPPVTFLTLASGRNFQPNAKVFGQLDPSRGPQSSETESPVAAQPLSVSGTSMAPVAPAGPSTPFREMGALASSSSGADRLQSVLSAEVWRRAAPWVAAGYGAGVLLMVARLLVALRGGRGLRGQSQPVTDPALLAVLHRTSAAVGLRAAPALAWCRRVAVPTVVGLVKPTILLPLSAASGLSPEQTEMLLLHELAHLRRHDHWINLVQWSLETVLFFHPAVWWLSSRIRTERELACDDRVLGTGVEQTPYAESLLRMAELSRRAPADEGGAALALAGSGRRFSGFGRRVLRLLDGRETHESLRPARAWPVVLGLLLLAGASFFGAVCAVAANEPRTEPEKAADPVALFSSGVRARVMGVAAHPRTGAVWAADGTPLPAVPEGFEDIGASVTPFDKTMAREFYVLIDTLPDGQSVGVRYELTERSASTAGGPDYEKSPTGKSMIRLGFAATLPEDVRKTALRLGIAAGPWETVVSSEGRRLTSGFSREVAGEEKQFGIMIAAPVRAGDKLHLTVTHNALDQDHRVVVTDSYGKQHTASRTSSDATGGMRQVSYEFHDIPPGTEIAKIEFQVRNYEWREIPGIHLQPSATGAASTAGPELLPQGRSSSGDGAVTLESVRIVPGQDETWAVALRATNATSQTQHLAVEVGTNSNVFLGGAANRTETFPLVPGFSGELRNKFPLITTFGIIRPTDVRIKVGRTKDARPHARPRGGVFLPEDAELLFETLLHLPTEDGTPADSVLSSFGPTIERVMIGDKSLNLDSGVLVTTGSPLQDAQHLHFSLYQSNRASLSAKGLWMDSLDGDGAWTTMTASALRELRRSSRYPFPTNIPVSWVGPGRVYAFDTGQALGLLRVVPLEEDQRWRGVKVQYKTLSSSSAVSPESASTQLRTGCAGGPFQIGQEVSVSLTTGTAEQPQVIDVRSVRFELRNDRLVARFGGSYRSWPHSHWRFRLTFLDATGRELPGSAETFLQNSGVVRRTAQVSPLDVEILFAARDSEGLTGAQKPSRFTLCVDQVPLEQAAGDGEISQAFRGLSAAEDAYHTSSPLAVLITAAGSDERAAEQVLERALVLAQDRSASPLARWQALILLGGLRDIKSLPVLTTLLADDPDEAVRSGAALALREFDTPAARKALESARSREQAEASREAIEAALAGRYRGRLGRTFTTDAQSAFHAAGRKAGQPNRSSDPVKAFEENAARTAEAYENYLKSYPISPYSVVARNLLALGGYARLSRFEEAKAELQRAIELARPDRFANLLEVNLAHVEHQAGELAAAEERLRRVMAQPVPASFADSYTFTPQLFIAPDHLARIRRDQGRHEEADALLEEIAATAERLAREHPQEAMLMSSYALPAYVQRVSRLLEQKPGDHERARALVREFRTRFPKADAATLGMLLDSAEPGGWTFYTPYNTETTSPAVSTGSSEPASTSVLQIR